MDQTRHTVADDERVLPEWEGDYVDRFRPARDAVRAEFRRKQLRPVRMFVRSYVPTLLPLAAALGILHWAPGVWTYVLAAIVAAFTQNALGILLHEGSHYFFHPKKKMSDLLADFLVGLPIFNTVEGYRVPHADHHRHSGKECDPYYELYGIYPNRRALVLALMRDLFFITSAQKFFGRYIHPPVKSGKGTWYALPGLAVVQLAIWALYYAITGMWWSYFVLWILPLAMIPPMINRVRTMVEHCPGFIAGETNRATIPGLIEYLCIAPYGYAYHFHHHLMPEVPYYWLAWTHKKLLEEGVTFTENDLTRFGYLRTFGSFWKSYRAR